MASHKPEDHIASFKALGMQLQLFLFFSFLPFSILLLFAILFFLFFSSIMKNLTYKCIVQEAKEWGATFINAHSGSDTWTSSQIIQFYTSCVAHEIEAAIPISHETHRRRALFNPFAAREILAAVPSLHITFDVSHWVVVSERVFNAVDDEAFWEDTLALVAARARLVHARVGYSDGPQINDPSAPEWEHEVAIHFKWWKRVWAGMAVRGLPYAYVEPEHGPAPYLHTLPHTRMPVADLWTVNSWVGRRVAEQFHTFSAATVYPNDPALFHEGHVKPSE